MSIAKMILPLVTLPYLTRVLTTDCYGVVSYVKAVMQYVQLIVDFGFMLSGTKDIVNVKNNKKMLEIENGNILVAKLLLSGISGFLLIILALIIPILRANFLYTILSFITVFLTCFLFDYLFRGLEKMHVITIRFVTMKAISTILTVLFVKNDSDVLWIPILDILGSVVAVLLVFVELKKQDIRIKITTFKDALSKIKESFVYFVSDIATTAFGALNTLLIGIYLSSSDVAYWSICMQLIGAVQSMYTPLTNGIYPEMVKNRNINIIKKTLKIFVPLIICGCIFTIIVSKYVMLIIGGEQYISAANILIMLTPVLFFSFIAMVIGWPTLGAIGRVKETSLTTIISSVFQCSGILILLLVNKFSLINVAMLRSFTEFVLMFSRVVFCCKFRNELRKGDKNAE